MGWERKEEEVEEEERVKGEEEGKRQEDTREREGAMFSLPKLHVPQITVPVSNPSFLYNIHIQQFTTGVYYPHILPYIRICTYIHIP